MERVMAKYDIIRKILSKFSSRQVLVGRKIFRRLGSQVLSRLCRQFESFTPIPHFTHLPPKVDGPDLKVVG